MLNHFTRATLVVASLLLISADANAARKIRDIENSPIPPGMSNSEIVETMQNAGRVRGWKIIEVAPGELVATIYIRDHMAQSTIRYTDNSYSITYKNSINLSYRDGKIHKAYNRWVRNLNHDIQQALRVHRR